MEVIFTYRYTLFFNRYYNNGDLAILLCEVGYAEQYLAWGTIFCLPLRYG